MLIYSMRTIVESIQLPYLTVDGSQWLVSGEFQTGYDVLVGENVEARDLLPVLEEGLDRRAVDKELQRKHFIDI